MNENGTLFESSLGKTRIIGTTETENWMIVLPSITLTDLEQANIETAMIRTSTIKRFLQGTNKSYREKIKSNIKDICEENDAGDYIKYFYPWAGTDIHVGNTRNVPGVSLSSFANINVKKFAKLWKSLLGKNPFPVHHWIYEENGTHIRFDRTSTGMASTMINNKPYRHYSSLDLQKIVNNSTVLQKLGAHICHLIRETSEKTVCLRP